MAKGSKTTTRKKAPEGETKAQKFSRLASQRVTAAVKKIKQIGNLSGTGYERTDQQIANIRTHLTNTVNETLAKFAPREAGKSSEPEIKI